MESVHIESESQIKPSHKINQKFKFTKENILNDITHSPLREETKQALLEWIADKEVHSYYQVTFEEILQYVWMVGIHLDGDSVNTFYQALDQNMSEAVCKCFTGRIGRLINSLSGLSPLVNIKIGDNEQIGNIMSLCRKKLEQENAYTIPALRILVQKELEERGYDKDKIHDIITTWILDEDAEDDDVEDDVNK
jgi:hypothetical protein